MTVAPADLMALVESSRVSEDELRADNCELNDNITQTRQDHDNGCVSSQPDGANAKNTA